MQSNQYPFPFLPLPYAYEALEPVIGKETVYLHHDKHLKAYVDNLNQLLAGLPNFHHWNLETILKNLATFPTNVREGIKNNAGGVYNHNLYFHILRSPKKGNQPSEEMMHKLHNDFGSYESFQAEFEKQASNRFGSGYAFLVVDHNDKFQIVSMANQDSPISENLFPILLIDVWEHAYYLDYQNRRKEYIQAFWDIINWDAVENLYHQTFRIESI